MSGILFVAAIAVAAGVMLLRRARRRKARRRWLSQPGRRPESPLAVSRFDAIDAAIESTRCHCSGRVERLAEAGRDIGGTRLRVVRVECRDCQDELDLFFDTSRVLN